MGRSLRWTIVVCLAAALAGLCLSATLCTAAVVEKSKTPLPGALELKGVSLVPQAIEIQPKEPMVEPGATSQPITIITRLPEKSKGAVTISLSGLPAGVTTRPAFPVTIKKKGTEGPEMKYVFRLVADKSVPPNGPAPVTFTAVVKPETPINGSLNTLTLNKTLNINVHPKSSEFDVYAVPDNLEIKRGKSATFDVVINRWGSEKRDVTINLTAPPMSGVSITPYPSSYTFPPSQDKKTYTISVSPTANLGTETLTFGATGIIWASGGTKSERFYLTYKTIQPDFSIDVSPKTAKVVQLGVSNPVVVTVNKVDGFDGPVTISAENLPPGVKSYTNPGATTGSSKVTFTAGESVDIPTPSPGTSNVTIVGTGVIDGKTERRTQTVQLTVEAMPGGFTVDLSPKSVTVEKGKDSAPITATITRFGGFNAAWVMVDLSGLPAGVTCSETLPMRTSDMLPSCTFKLKVGSSASAGTIKVTATGAAYGLPEMTASSDLSLIVTSPGGTTTNPSGDYTIAATTSPSPLNIEFKKTGTLNVKVTRSGSFTGDVNLTLSGLPDGVTTPNVKATIPAGSDTTSYTLTATEASKFETDKTLTVSGTASINGKNVPHSATAKVSVLRVMGDFKKVDPSSKSSVTSSDGKLKAEITGTNPYNVTFQKSAGGSWTGVTGPIPFAIGPTSNLGGVCFNDASTCGVVLTGKGSGGYGFASDYQYTILWLYGKPVMQQQYQVFVNKGYDNFWPELRFSPDGSLALLTAANKFGTANYEVHLVDTVDGSLIGPMLLAKCINGGAVTYPSAKVYLSGGKTKVDVTADGTTQTYDVP